MRIVLATLLWLSFASSASSHALWLEPDAAGYQLRFGENLREGSPGLLDRLEPIPAAKAFGASGEPVLRAERKSTSFQLASVPEGSVRSILEVAGVADRQHPNAQAVGGFARQQYTKNVVLCHRGRLRGTYCGIRKTAG